jgi:hypothetical protein
MKLVSTFNRKERKETTKNAKNFNLNPLRPLRKHFAPFAVNVFLLFLLLTFVATPNLYAVPETESDTLKMKYPLSIGFNYHYGYTMNHNAAMEFLNTKHFSTYELSLQLQTIGKKYWEQKCAYPAIGITFMYSELANPKYLGRMFGLYPYLDATLFSWKQKHKIIFTVGLGMAYGTKPYDRFDNYKNISYGSHFNVVGRFGLKGNFRIFPKTDISGSVNLTHVSNGTTKEPNYGLNSPSVCLGVNYQINDASGKRIVRTEEVPQKYPFTLQIASYGALKDIDWLTGTPLYFVGDLNINMIKQYRFARSWGAGIGLNMDFANMKKLKNEGTFSGSAFSYIVPSVKAIHLFHISRLSIGTELCYMLYQKEKLYNSVYANLTAGVKINDWLTAGMLLRAGFVYADYFGFGLNFRVWEI